MAKYIDADRLRAEIEKRLKNVRDYMNGAGMRYKGPKYYKAQGKESAYDALLTFIDSLQQEQPEMDLEIRKQIEELANDWHHKGFASDEDCPLCMQDLMDILWHFYELGKNSK